MISTGIDIKLLKLRKNAEENGNGNWKLPKKKCRRGKRMEIAEVQKITTSSPQYSNPFQFMKQIRKRCLKKL